MRAFLCPLLLAAVVARAPDAAADDSYRLLVEVGGGVNIPLNRYVDIETDDGYIFAENELHGNVNVALLIGGFSIRYAANVVNIGYYEERLPDSILTPLNQALNNMGEESIAKDTSGTLNETLTFHTLGLGYRFYFANGGFQPYLPIEVGAAIVSGDALGDKALYGISLGTGFGLDIHVAGFLWVGLAARYTFILTEPYPETALIGFSSEESTFEAAVAMEHLIGVTAQLQARF